MAVTYTWKLTALKKTQTTSLTDVVVGTRWECTGTNEYEMSGTFNGATTFSLNTINTENFIAWENLTEEIVLGWIQDVLNRGGMDHVKAQIQKQIDAKNTTVEEVSANNFPWVTE